MNKSPQTDDERLIQYINKLNNRILALEASKKLQDASINDIDRKLTKFIDLVERVRSEYEKLKTSFINLKEKVGNLNINILSLSSRLKNK